MNLSQTRSFITAALFSVLCFATFTQSARAETLLLFDASQSMLDQFDGQSRLEAAKDAVYDFITSLGDEAEVGLRLYAHKNHAGNEAAACKETELVQNFTTSHSSIISKVAGVDAVGSYTPTAYALLQTKNDFTSGAENVLVLLTDGKETCGGDPIAAAKELCEAGISVQTYVIGLGVDADTRGQLTDIAEAGCGEYYDATDSASLAASFSAISAVVEEPIDRSRDTIGTAVRGGSQFDNAVELQPGTYHLDHHQKEKEFDYFYVNMRPGEKYYLSIGLSEYAIDYDEASNTFVNERAAPSLSSTSEGEMYILSRLPNNQEDSFLRIRTYSNGHQDLDYAIFTYNQDGSLNYQSQGAVDSGHSGQKVTAHPLIGNFDRLYFKIGNDYSEMHKMVPFSIEKMSSNGDSTEVDSNENITNSEIMSGSESDSVNTGPSLGVSKTMLLVGGAIALLLILLVLFLLLRSKKQPVLTEQSAPPAPGIVNDPNTLPPTQ